LDREESVKYLKEFDPLMCLYYRKNDLAV